MTVRGFFGGLLMTIGVLVMILSGGCTVIFLSMLNVHNLDQVWAPLLIGGVPFVVSWGIFLIGKRIRYPNANPNKFINKLPINFVKFLGVMFIIFGIMSVYTGFTWLYAMVDMYFFKDYSNKDLMMILSPVPRVLLGAGFLYIGKQFIFKKD